MYVPIHNTSAQMNTASPSPVYEETSTTQNSPSLYLQIYWYLWSLLSQTCPMSEILFDPQRCLLWITQMSGINKAYITVVLIYITESLERSRSDNVRFRHKAFIFTDKNEYIFFVSRFDHLFVHLDWSSKFSNSWTLLDQFGKSDRICDNSI